MRKVIRLTEHRRKRVNVQHCNTKKYRPPLHTNSVTEKDKPIPVELQQRIDKNLRRVRLAFNLAELAMICKLRNSDFSRFAKCITVGDQNYWHRDKDSNVLAVCHLDSVQAASHTLEMDVPEVGKLIYSPRLDDRLGAYTIIKLLPKLGLNFDLLLCDEEERGRSSAARFTTNKAYDWGVEFDRKGDDVVMYRYKDDELDHKLESAGYKLGFGSFTDICSLEHLKCKFFNVGIAYEDYHSFNAFFVLETYLLQVAKFLTFYQMYKNEHMEHNPTPYADHHNYRRGLTAETEDYDDMYGNWYESGRSVLPIVDRRSGHGGKTSAVQKELKLLESAKEIVEVDEAEDPYGYNIWNITEQDEYYAEWVKLKSLCRYVYENALYFNNNKVECLKEIGVDIDKSWFSFAPELSTDKNYLEYCRVVGDDPALLETMKYYLTNKEAVLETIKASEDYLNSQHITG